MNHRAMTHRDTSRTRRRFTCLATFSALALLLGVVPVSAAFTDRGLLDTQLSGDFSIGGIDEDGTVHLPGDGAQLEAEVRPVDGMVPGTTVSVGLEVFNNSESVEARIGVDLSAAGDVPDLLRYSAVLVQDGTTTVLFGSPDTPDRGAPAHDVPADLGAVLAPRGTAPLADGDAYAGPADSTATVQVLVHLLDDPSTSTMSAASTRLGITVAGTSS